MCLASRSTAACFCVFSSVSLDAVDSSCKLISLFWRERACVCVCVGWVCEYALLIAHVQQRACQCVCVCVCLWRASAATWNYGATPCACNWCPTLICCMNTLFSLTGGIGVILYRYWFVTVSPAWLMKAIKRPIFLMIQTLRIPLGSGLKHKQQMGLVHLLRWYTVSLYLSSSSVMMYIEIG